VDDAERRFGAGGPAGYEQSGRGAAARSVLRQRSVSELGPPHARRSDDRSHLRSARGPACAENPDHTVVMSRYRDFMTKQTTVRLPEELADQAETVARVKGTSVNQLIVDSLGAEIDRVRADKDFTSRAKRLLARDKELLDRLAK